MVADQQVAPPNNIMQPNNTLLHYTIDMENQMERPSQVLRF